MIDVLLLLGLPASGKSEIRRFLGEVPPAPRLADFALGRLVHVDDFPYVWAMRMVDAWHHERALPGAYFQGSDLPFRDPREWLALSLLLRWDLIDIEHRAPPRPRSPGRWLIDRIERARRAVDLPPVVRWTEQQLGGSLEAALSEAAGALLDQRGPRPRAGERLTYLVELARGGADWMRPPFPAPLGYAGSVPVLGREILARAGVLHVRVSPDSSHRRNRDRADPSRPGSILGHSVPDVVMRQDYGCDDLDWLAAQGAHPDTIRIACGEHPVDLPIVAFDNEPDRTSFVRQPAAEWTSNQVETLYATLSVSLTRLAAAGLAAPANPPPDDDAHAASPGL